MTPDALRCESRRPGGTGPWRYSLAVMIVLAAVLDVLWWVPAHQDSRSSRAFTPVERCQKMKRLEREIMLRQAELALLRVEVDLDVLAAEMSALQID